MPDLESLFLDYAERYLRGESPQASRYLARAEGDRDDLDAALTALVAAVPPQRPQEAAIRTAIEELSLASDLPIDASAVLSFATKESVASETSPEARFDAAAVEALRRVADDYRDVAYSEGEAAVLRVVADSLSRAGEFSQALETLDRAAGAASRSGKRSLVTILTRAGDAASRLGRLDTALERFEHALVLVKGEGDSAQEARIRREVVRCLEELGREAEAQRVADPASEQTAAQAGTTPVRPSLGAFLRERVQAPAEQVIEGAKQLLGEAVSAQVAPVQARSVAIDQERIRVELKAEAGQVYGIGRVQVDRQSGWVTLVLRDVIDELRGTRPYVIFPLVRRASSPTLHWAGADEGLVDGVVRPAPPIGATGRSVEIPLGTLDLPTADPTELVAHFLLASDAEVMPDLHLHYYEGGESNRQP